MLQNYLKVAWRSLEKNQLHSLINIIGLAVSISTCIVLFMVYSYESGFDKSRSDYDRIYRVYSQFSGSFEGKNRGVPGPTAEQLKSDFSGLESATAFHTVTSDVLIINGQEDAIIFSNQIDIVLADGDFFQTMGDYLWLSNYQEAHFSEPYQVILSAEKARKYFDLDNPLEAIGKQLIYFDSLQVTVSGIVEIPKYHSDFCFSDFISLASSQNALLKERINLEAWSNTNSGSQLFIKLLPNVSAAKIESQFQPLIDRYNEENDAADWVYNYRLQPLSDLHFNAELGIFDSSHRSTANRKTLRILLLISFLLIVVASINFVNLETAKATLRAKDIGIRKTLGGSRQSLITQYLGETFLLTLFSIILSLIFADFGSWYFSDYLPPGFTLDIVSFNTLIFLVFLWILVSLLAGLYPATIITKFDPGEALNGRLTMTGPKSNLRRGLIVFQFAIAQLFIAGTLFVGKQINYMLEKDLGFNTEALIHIHLPWKEVESKRKLFVENLRSIAGIQQISVHDDLPASNNWRSSIFSYRNEKGDEIRTNVYRKYGDVQYIPLYGFDLLAGRNFRATDTLSELVINETYASELGFSNPADAINISLEVDGQIVPVVGVVKDFNTSSLHNPMQPVVLGYSAEYGMVSIKLASDQKSIAGIGSVLKEVEMNWNQHFNKADFEYAFYDETISRFYEAEKRTAKLLKVATAIALIISCLGLFGLATFMAERRRKEIGIRKVLGATISGIVLLLSQDIIKLILVALLVATPISMYFANDWLNSFADHISVSSWIFATTGVFALFVALITVGFQGFRAAVANPVDSLKNE